MFNSQVHRNRWLALAVAAVLTAASCSKTATDEANNTAKPVAAAKPAVAVKAATAAKVPEPILVTVPKGTEISAATRQTLATDKNKVGDTFTARLTTPIQVEGKTVIPKGAEVTCRIVKVKKHELKVTLASVVLHGKSYALDSNSITGPKSQPKNDVKDGDKPKANKDVTVVAAKSQLTFKLAKAVTLPVKG
ncbi:MAG TPA: hypothetical protein VE263_19160 [Candidatus Angelobacter sp.]|nr:hypothetical protein [Candidatus Angelobacter sp.]